MSLLYSNHKIKCEKFTATLALQGVYCAKETVISIHELEMIYNLFNRHCYPQLSCSTPTAWHLYPDGSPPQSHGSPQPLWQQEPRRLPPCPHASLRCASSTPLSRPGARMTKRWWTDDGYIEVMVIMVVMVVDAWCSVNILSQKLQLAEVLERRSANFHTGDRRWTTWFSSL